MDAAQPPAGLPPPVGAAGVPPPAPDLHLHIPPEATPRRRRRYAAGSDSAYEGSDEPSPSGGRYGIDSWDAGGAGGSRAAGWEWPLLRAWRRPEGLLILWLLAALLVGVSASLGCGGAPPPAGWGSGESGHGAAVGSSCRCTWCCSSPHWQR